MLHKIFSQNQIQFLLNKHNITIFNLNFLIQAEFESLSGTKLTKEEKFNEINSFHLDQNDKIFTK